MSMSCLSVERESSGKVYSVTFNGFYYSRERSQLGTFTDVIERLRRRRVIVHLMDSECSRSGLESLIVIMTSTD